MQVVGMAPARAIGRLLMALNFEAFVDESYTDGFTGNRTSDGEFILGWPHSYC